jgi:hypothetical protein
VLRRVGNSPEIKNTPRHITVPGRSSPVGGARFAPGWPRHLTGACNIQLLNTKLLYIPPNPLSSAYILWQPLANRLAAFGKLINHIIVLHFGSSKSFNAVGLR